MADKSNYADKDTSSEITEHRLFFRSDFRAYTPSDGNSKEIFGQLAAKSTGDWPWHPGRDKALGANFTTYKPSGGASSSHDRFCKRCDAFYCECPRHVQFGTPAHTASESAEDFQERCRAAHKAAGDYQHVYRTT